MKECERGLFQCSVSKKCLELYQVCNDEPDCGPSDNSDEAACRKLNLAVIHFFLRNKNVVFSTYHEFVI